MTPRHKVLLTGGSGLLGSELRRLIPEASFPSSGEFDVTDLAQMESYVRRGDFETLVHAAAFTSPPKVDRDPMRALDVNIIGTANVVKLCQRTSLRLLYISTDYVFRGDAGYYREEDPVYPVNKYAWSKLGGECAVRLHENSLIVRTSFGPNEFPYERAFVDQWSSRQSVREIAAKIVHLLDLPLKGTIHIGGPRRTVAEYARSLSGGRAIGQLSIRDVDFAVPVDTSLDCGRFESLMKNEAPTARGAGAS